MSQLILASVLQSHNFYFAYSIFYKLESSFCTNVAFKIEKIFGEDLTTFLTRSICNKAKEPNSICFKHGNHCLDITHQNTFPYLLEDVITDRENLQQHAESSFPKFSEVSEILKKESSFTFVGKFQLTTAY